MTTNAEHSLPEDDLVARDAINYENNMHRAFPPGALLTRSDMAVRLHCSERTLRRMVARGDVPPPVQLGPRLVWEGASVFNHIMDRIKHAKI